MYDGLFFNLLNGKKHRNGNFQDTIWEKKMGIYEEKIEKK